MAQKCSEAVLRLWQEFWEIGAYDTDCQRVAQGEITGTCRQVGTHRKEKRKNGELV